MSISLLLSGGFVTLANAQPAALLSARNPSVPLPAGGDGNSAAPSLSADGRYVVFSSAANDLVPGGNSFYSLNVFLRDRLGNITQLVSVNLGGTGGGNGNSMLGQVSSNGQFVVFQSDAGNLVPNDTNGFTDIFVRDLVAGTTSLVSVSTNGGAANGPSTDPVMTPDGRYVAFISGASNLVPGDTNSIPDVFVRDLVAGTTYLVSVGATLPPGSPVSSIMATPVISPDGRYVAFFSIATNLVSAVPATTQGEVYVRNLFAGTTTWASANAASIVSTSLGLSAAPAYHPRLSADGRYVAFKAGPAGLGAANVILDYDMTMGTTVVINTNGIGGSTLLDDSYGPEMTPDGRFTTFAKYEGAASLGYSSVHVWDSQAAVDTLVSDDGSGVPANTVSYMPVISTNGQFVAFLSNASNLASNTVSSGFHIFLRDLQAGATQLADVDTNGIGSTDDGLTSLSLSANGQFIAFSSPDGSLVNLDINHAYDVFVRDSVAGATELISQRDSLVIPQAGDGFSAMTQQSVSADGRWVAFSSVADDLVPNDTNDTADVFVRDTVNGTNLLVSVGMSGGSALGGTSTSPVISTNGRYVAFISSATNLVAGLVNTRANVFRRDLQTGTTVLVSVGTNGMTPGNNNACDPVISADGQCVVFLSTANNLAAAIGGGNTYWRNVAFGQTEGLGTPVTIPFAFDPSMSSDGRYLAYAYAGTTLRIHDTQLGTDIYTNTGAVTSAAIDPTGTKIFYRLGNTFYVDNILPRSNLFSIQTTSTSQIRNASCWSDDGRWLTFVSTTNLSGGDDGTNKVYLRDFQTGTLALVGVVGPGTGSTGAISDGPVMSGSGRFVAYRSLVTNTVIGDTTAPPNLFLLDRLTASNLVLTINQGASVPLLWVSRPVISDGGATVAFGDLDSGLVPGDINRQPDAFGVSLDVNAALVDSDGDGIPDWWMMKYFGHPTGQTNDMSLAQDDADGSGMSNLQDYIAGTSPLDPSSAFRLSITAPSNNVARLTWPAVTGRAYQITYKTNLTDPAWLTPPGSVWVLGGRGSFLAPATQPTGFYRALVSQ
jgi:Tol biopolymer transport system component